MRLDTHPGEIELLEDLMQATGAVAVTMEDNADEPVLEPGVGETPLWRHIRLTGLYDANAINLLLDPGLAFGTGTHPTTSLCLSQIARHL